MPSPHNFSKDPAHYWNCWTNNYVRAEGGYIIHVFEETPEERSERTLCGYRYQEGAFLNLTETTIGCIRCNAILVKRGVIDADHKPISATSQTKPAA